MGNWCHLTQPSDRSATGGKGDPPVDNLTYRLPEVATALPEVAVALLGVAMVLPIPDPTMETSFLEELEKDSESAAITLEKSFFALFAFLKQATLLLWTSWRRRN
ncbi:hypothetical protein Y1Q_0021094 [Alligator mississippiensis]|uniref:Uncharacterized protein n=1 Tax=Alligator mississippiensis TaxID=8496 RepID=A0A151NSJ9_ALLMI|nr:hypothetical protein Y1Q_0021094 [Alligator mississippiensis]